MTNDHFLILIFDDFPFFLFYISSANDQVGKISRSFLLISFFFLLT